MNYDIILDGRSSLSWLCYNRTPSKSILLDQSELICNLMTCIGEPGTRTGYSLSSTTALHHALAIASRGDNFFKT